MTILVTGGAGFIGSHLCERLLAMGHEVVCVDDFNAFYDPTIKHHNVQPALGHPRYHLELADISDEQRLEAIFERYAISSIVHLAGRAGVRPSLEQPMLYEQVNIHGTLTLLELSRRHAIRNFIFGSSSSVYGAGAAAPFREDDAADHPISPYAATKRAGELLCYTYHHLYGIPITCLRFFTVYGPRQRPDLAIRKFIQAIEAGRAIHVFGDGKTARDYTYVDDIVNGIITALNTDPPLAYEIINLGNSSPVPLNQLISLIEKAVGREAMIVREPDQPGDVPLTYASIEKANRLLGWEPVVRIEDGLARFVKWLRAEESAAALAAERTNGQVG